MSFNLNKNGGSAPSKKSSFDLSKSETEVSNDQHAPEKSSAPSRNVRYILLALLIIGGSGWYFTRNRGDVKATADISQASPDSSAQTTPAVRDSVAIATSSVASQTANTADSTTKHNVGSTQPVTVDPKSGIASRAETAAKPQTDDGAPAKTATRVAAYFTAGSSHPGNITGNLPTLIQKKLKNNDRLIIHVLGYASSEGSLAINRQISQARADAYKRLLVQKGIAEANISAQGKGIENPVAGNDTEAGRKKNRRVEVSWYGD